MEEWQKRVGREFDELSERLEKLRAFKSTPQFRALSGLDQHILQRQSAYMTGYRVTLLERIARFK